MSLPPPRYYYQAARRGGLPKRRLPSSTPSESTSSPSPSIRRSLPPPPRDKNSTSGLSDAQAAHVIARLRSFEHHIPLKHDAKYTFAINSSSPNFVYFFEYRGIGPPCDSFGASGDIYIDLTHNSYALYGKGDAGWVQWTVPGLFEHPFLTDTLLWVDPDNIVWERPANVSKIARDADISIAIHNMLAFQTLQQGDPIFPNLPKTHSTMVNTDPPRKRPRVEEVPSSTVRKSEPPSSLSEEIVCFFSPIN